MLPAWDSQRKPFWRLVLLFLAANVASFACAQGLPKTRIPAARTIILPLKIVAGAPATLAVLDSAGHLLPNVVVELSNGQKVTTDATGRAQFAAPGQAGKFIAKLSGQEIFATSIVAAAANSAEPSSAQSSSQLSGQSSPQSSVDASPAPVQVVSYPRALTIHDRFTIEGTGFRGAADSNHVFLAAQPCLVVASSPVSLVVLPGPRTPVGAIPLRVNVAGQNTAEIPVSAVSLEFSGPTETPDAGTEGKIILSVRGASEPLTVEVRNASPRIIQFPHGSIQRLTTSGGEQNTAPVEMKFLASGNYTVTARLIPTVSETPPGKN
jgi:hypothetical protein